VGGLPTEPHRATEGLRISEETGGWAEVSRKAPRLLRSSQCAGVRDPVTTPTSRQVFIPVTAEGTIPVVAGLPTEPHCATEGLLIFEETYGRAERRGQETLAERG
jgi:hypothetical protein